MFKFQPPRSIFLLIFAALLGVLVTAASLLLADDSDHEEREHRRNKDSSALRGLPVLTNATWKEECSSCHTLFHPGLLPARSWEKIMQGLSDHFGDDASVDAPVAAEITQFLTAHASDRQESRRAAKINRSIAPGETPLKITETLYFQKKHDEIPARVFKRQKISSPSNCVACHGTKAEIGVFDEELISIPKGP